ncbi:MAG: type II/IV secretion system ATPase subunit [Candidatus Bilamarchaeaceae archaeon]
MGKDDLVVHEEGQAVEGEDGAVGRNPESEPSGSDNGGDEPRRQPSEAYLLAKYSFDSEGLPVEVRIVKRNDFVPVYEVFIPGIAEGTKLILETKLKGELIAEVKLDISEILDPKKYEDVKNKFLDSAEVILDKNFPSLLPSKKKILAVYLMQNTLGLGELEALLYDEKLEEVVINNSRDPVWVYHKRFGWCKTNLRLKNEDNIYDYSSMIARKVGRQINILNPLLDAHLPNGDRVNSTLFPVSQFGNTITIRKFSRNPWSITNFIRSKTISSEVASVVWMCMQNELSMLVAGGTGSGKTSFLNAMSGLIPPNQRIVSIEDTRELTLPSFLHWVPMVTREANPEGKGEVTMLDLMVNALRQRPDRILVGEVRRQREAEILFEAMHTGHSVYATLHADNSEQTISRLTNPPINIPSGMLDALAGVVVQFRHRRFNIRRTLEFSEVTQNGGLNTVYRWDIKSDKLKSINSFSRIQDLLSLYAGLTPKEIVEDVKEKTSILDWMVGKGYEDVDKVGSVISTYYTDPELVLETAKKNSDWSFGEK